MKMILKCILNSMCVFLAVGIITPKAAANDLLLKNGKKFTGVFVLEETDTHLKFRHDAGMSRLPKNELDEKFAAKLGIVFAESKEKALSDQFSLIKSRIVQIVTRDGRTFLIKDLTSVDPNALKFTTPGGLAKVLFSELPTDTATLLGFDPKAALAHNEKQEREEARMEAAKQRREYAETTVDGSRFEAKIVPIQKLKGGWLCQVSERRIMAISNIVREDSRSLTNRPTVYVERREVDVSEEGEMALVQGLGQSTTVNETQSSIVYNVGKYRYNSVGNGEREVPIFFTDRQAGIRHVAQRGLDTIFDDDVTPAAPLGGDKASKAYGTGFFVTANGYVATNHHVVEGASKIRVHHDGKTLDAVLIAVDEENDVAIVKIEADGVKPLPVQSGRPIGLGADVFTIGFPRPNTQGRNAKYTEGTVSALTGIDDAQNQYQVSVPIQGGNSGGPLVAKDGYVMGIMVSTLNPLATLARGQGLPQNVNYAIKIDHLVALARGKVPALAEQFPNYSMDSPNTQEAGIEKNVLISQTQSAVALIEVDL